MRAAVGRWLVVVLIALGVVEVQNTARTWRQTESPRRVPQGYVSPGLWSLGAFVRPPKSDANDITPCLHAAAEAWRHEPDLYTDYVDVGPSNIYPPTAAVALFPLGAIGATHGVGRACQVADALGRLCVLAVVVIVTRQLPRAWPRGTLVLAACTLLAFFPLRWMLTCVQAQSFVTLFLVAATVAYGRGHTATAGVLVALAACVKPYLAPLVLFGLLRREWRFVAVTVAGAALLAGASLWWVGWGPWHTYLCEILPGASRGYGHWPNQSVNGLVLRWFGYHEFARVYDNGPANVASVVALVAFLPAAVWPRRPWRAEAVGAGGAASPRVENVGAAETRTRGLSAPALLRALDFALAILGLTLASPIAWEHYYSAMLILFALAVRAGWSLALGRIWWVLLGATYVVLGSYWLPLAQFNTGPLTLVNSCGLYAAVVLFVAAWYARARVWQTASRGA